MQTLFENSTFAIDYDEQRSLIIQRWFGDLTEEQYKENMKILVEWILKLPPVHFNLVYPNLNFPITPELQEWTKSNVFLAVDRHKRLKKAAFIVPQEVFDQIVTEFLSVEQTMEENFDLFETRYFTSEKDAYMWFAEL
ncbi:MAG: STAS/SEC14 domain-containing protein [Microscillaceae bacterium]|nr:STAS/SEC14 domain-containing protein [Microscillaceae bacterium]MDW8461375.1 STAS/SEC14 domain-containing protein [Cytophagales bacterium]